MSDIANLGVFCNNNKLSHFGYYHKSVISVISGLGNNCRLFDAKYRMFRTNNDDWQFREVDLLPKTPIQPYNNLLL